MWFSPVSSLINLSDQSLAFINLMTTSILVTYSMEFPKRKYHKCIVSDIEYNRSPR